MPTPRDPVEEGERILGLWTVLTMDKIWSVALEYSPNFEHSTNALATRVDTPWPLEMEDFEQVCHSSTFSSGIERSQFSRHLKGRLPQQVRTAATIHNFLGGVPTPDLGISSRAIEAKAAVLWERVAVFVRKWNAGSCFVLLR